MTKSEIVAIAQSLKASGASNDIKEDMAITLLNLGAFLTSKGNTTQYTFHDYMSDSECSVGSKFLEVFLKVTKKDEQRREALSKLPNTSFADSPIQL